MPSGPLFASLASRALDHQEAASSGRRRFRRLAARLSKLAERQEPKAPLAAGQRGLDRPHRQGRERRDLTV